MRAHVEFPVHQRGEVFGWAQVDLDDAHLARESWHQHHGYPCRSVAGACQTLHRAVGGDLRLDHRDRNRLNAKRSNLRPATQAENLQNVGSRTGRPRGVFPTRGGRWRAIAKTQGKQHYVGTFDTVEEADKAISAWRQEHFAFAVEVAG